MEQCITFGYGEIADALRTLEEALQQNTDAFSGRLGPAHATEEGEELFEEEAGAPPTGAASTLNCDVT
jgi:hypothetical protein